MEEELIGIYENEDGDYTWECPHCGRINTITVEDDGEDFDTVSIGEVVDVYCEKCGDYFEAQLA